jgi:enoyl-CoA hydratase
MVDVPLSPDSKVTVERRKQIVLIGINRPQMLNKIDPDTFKCRKRLLNIP